MNACRRPFVCFAVLSLVAALANVSQATLTAHWKFDEVGGSTASDSAGANTGTLTAFTSPGSTWVAGKFGNALGFDHADARVSVSGAAFGPTWTAGGWYNAPLVASGTWHTMFRGANYHHIIAESGTNVLGVYQVGFFGTDFDLDTLAAGWHQIIAVGSGGDTRLFVDGVSVGTVVGKQVTEPTVVVGNYQSGAQLWDNLMDDVGIFDVAYNDTFVKAIYTLGNEATLAYDLGLVDQLFTLFNAASGSLTIGNVKWNYTTGLSGTPGQVLNLGNDFSGNPQYSLLLDQLGNGLATTFVPEPSTLSLLGLGIVGLAVRSRRRRRAA